MSVFYPNQLKYLADLAEALEGLGLPVDKDGYYGLKILIMDTSQDRVLGEVLKDEEGSLRIELEDLVE